MIFGSQQAEMVEVARGVTQCASYFKDIKNS